jgi:hypothetical protein
MSHVDLHRLQDYLAAWYVLGVAIPHLNTESWPYVLIVYPPAIDPPEFDAFVADVKERVARRTTAKDRPVLIVDIRLMPPEKVKPRSRALMTKGLDRPAREYPLCPLAEVFVCASRLGRGAITAYNWLRGSRHEVHVCEQLDEAYFWAKAYYLEHH